MGIMCLTRNERRHRQNRAFYIQMLHEDPCILRKEINGYHDESPSGAVSNKMYREAGYRIYTLIRRHEVKDNPVLPAIPAERRPRLERLKIEKVSVRNWTRGPLVKNWVDLPQSTFAVVGLFRNEF